MKQQFIWAVCLVAFCQNTSSTTASLEVSNSSTKPHWDNDYEFMESMHSTDCDFARILINGSNGTVGNWENDYPVLLSGLIDDWAAREKWTKENFLRLYGNKEIRIGSESSIVYSGGVAENTVTVRELLQMFAEKDESAFVFDTTVLQAIPELRQDFTVPEMFAHWDSEEQEDAAQMWHMLSLGPSRAGLPFHNHGKTWLAVVHGAKRWFVYPPGYGPPPQIDALVNPLLPVSDWLRDIYPHLLDYPKPPLYRYQEMEQEEQRKEKGDAAPLGYRPLECMQHAGEVLHLPNRWAHMTVNVGDTVALGGQNLLSEEDRYAGATAALDKNPLNFEALKDIALVQANRATRQAIDHREKITRSAAGTIRLREGAELYHWLTQTKDSWLVYYFHNDTYGDFRLDALNQSVSDQQRVHLETMDEMARILYGEVNVATLDLTMQDISWFHNMPVSVDPTTGTSHYALPVLKLHRGESRSEDVLVEEFATDTEGVVVDAELGDAGEIERFVNMVLEDEDMDAGSVLTASKISFVQFDLALDFFKRALRVRPRHLEIRSIMCEVVAEMHALSDLSLCVEDMVRVLEELDEPGASQVAQSSLYHRMARLYVSKRMYEQATPLLLQSVAHNPRNSAAHMELLVNYINLGDKGKATETLTAVRALHNLSSIEDFPEVEAAVLNMASGDEEAAKYTPAQ